MIVHITEQFHDYGLQRYYVETNDLSSELDPPNPIEKLVLDACKKKAFLSWNNCWRRWEKKFLPE